MHKTLYKCPLLPMPAGTYGQFVSISCCVLVRIFCRLWWVGF